MTRIRKSVLVFCVVLIVVTTIVLVLKPKRIHPGQVVDQLGVYRFPTGNRSFEIIKDESKNLIINVRHNTTQYHFFPYTRKEKVASFESERDWFVTVDQYNRIWVYHGHWDKAWGKSRQMFGGGTVPYAPAVLMHGGWFLSSGMLVTGQVVVTETSDWGGVPQSFLDRIPGKDAAQWGNVKPAPKKTTSFTEIQHKLLLDRMMKRK